MFKYSKLIVAGVLVGGLLAGCGAAEESSSGSSSQEEAKPAKQEDKIPKPKKDDEGNTILEVVGQKHKSDAGTGELMKIKKVNETVEIAPIKVTVQDIKVIKLSDVDPTFAEDLALMADESPEKLKKGFSYIQVQYSAENTEDRSVYFNGLMNLITDQGEQIAVDMKDFLFDDADMESEYIGKVKQQYKDAVIVENADIASVKLVFDNSTDTDYMKITDEQTVEYTLD